jgi:hypothetical protein
VILALIIMAMMIPRRKSLSTWPVRVMAGAPVFCAESPDSLVGSQLVFCRGGRHNQGISLSIYDQAGHAIAHRVQGNKKSPDGIYSAEFSRRQASTEKRPKKQTCGGTKKKQKMTEHFKPVAAS